MPRTSSFENLPDAEAEQILLAEVEALKRRNRMNQLKETKVFVQRSNILVSMVRAR